MKPYDDPNCKCHKIMNEINQKYPNCNWNCDEACKEWNKRKEELIDNSIEFEDLADENYACTCPTCGNFICGWCV